MSKHYTLLVLAITLALTMLNDYLEHDWMHRNMQDLNNRVYKLELKR